MRNCCYYKKCTDYGWFQICLLWDNCWFMSVPSYIASIWNICLFFHVLPVLKIYLVHILFFYQLVLALCAHTSLSWRGCLQVGPISLDCSVFYWESCHSCTLRLMKALSWKCVCVRACASLCFLAHNEKTASAPWECWSSFLSLSTSVHPVYFS